MTTSLVFQDTGEPGGLMFVEAEDADGNSVVVGEWVRGEDDRIELRLDVVPATPVTDAASTTTNRTLRTLIQGLAGAGAVIAAIIGVLVIAGVSVPAELAAGLTVLATALASWIQNTLEDRGTLHDGRK